jgi:hypothetical protein
VRNVSEGKSCESTGDQSSHRGCFAHVTDRPFTSKLTVGLQIKTTKEEANNGGRNHRGYIKKTSLPRKKKSVVDGKQESPHPAACLIRP